VALAGWRRGSVEMISLRNPIDQACSIEQRIDLIDQLLDIARDHYSLLGIAGIGARLRRLGDARRFVEPLPDLSQVGFSS
jgi:hypothetical protein